MEQYFKEHLVIPSVKRVKGYVGIYLFFLSFKSVHGEIIIILKFIDKPD